MFDVLLLLVAFPSPGRSHARRGGGVAATSEYNEHRNESHVPLTKDDSKDI